MIRRIDLKVNPRQAAAQLANLLAGQSEAADLKVNPRAAARLAKFIAKVD
jgi:hypothetical protein